VWIYVSQEDMASVCVQFQPGIHSRVSFEQNCMSQELK